MKIAIPQVLKPKAERTPSQEELPEIQEQPMMYASYKKQSSSIADKVEAVAEKAVQAVDPLNIFAPCIHPTRLIIHNSLFDQEEPHDIIECRTNDPYLNLQITAVKSTDKKDTLVMKDSSNETTVAIVERTGEKPNVTYEIFKTSPVHYGQEFTKTTNGQDLFTLANVERSNPKELNVMLTNQTEPTYTIGKAGIPHNYATNYFIKQVGVKEEVASTHPWEKSDAMLVVNPGMDVILMYCLAAIADDAEASGNKESFSEMLNPRNLVRKMTSSSEGEKQDDA